MSPSRQAGRGVCGDGRVLSGHHHSSFRETTLPDSQGLIPQVPAGRVWSMLLWPSPPVCCSPSPDGLSGGMQYRPRRLSRDEGQISNGRIVVPQRQLARTAGAGNGGRGREGGASGVSVTQLGRCCLLTLQGRCCQRMGGEARQLAAGRRASGRGKRFSLSLSLSRSLSLSFSLSVCLCLSVCPSVCLCLSLSVSLCHSLSLSLCLSLSDY